MPVTVHVEARDGDEVARLTLNRPAKLNALDSETLAALRETVLELHQRQNLRVLVLTGAGKKAFSAGADITELAQHTPASARRFITLLHQTHCALRALPVPVICRINGYCLGAGLEMAVSCDIRIAVEHAVLGMPEVQVGLPSVIEAALLPRLIGWGKTNELLMTGESVNATQALSWGLIEAVASSSEPRSVCRATGERDCQSRPLSGAGPEKAHAGMGSVAPGTSRQTGHRLSGAGLRDRRAQAVDQRLKRLIVVPIGLVGVDRLTIPGGELPRSYRLGNVAQLTQKVTGYSQREPP